jgi:hypothetical protein
MIFTLIPAARKTEPQLLKASKVTVKGFQSNICDLSIVFENAQSKLRYYISATVLDYIRCDTTGFDRVWFEFGRLDREYEITLLTE